jgi:2-(1,2-epoxy-1,2-dihydrophenyl)acetyl-CoA isomerase
MTAPTATPLLDQAPHRDVLSRTAEGICTLTLNRPQSLNAFTVTMLGELHQALEAAAADDSVRCVVLAGAGRAFSAGQDLSDPAAAPDLREGAPRPNLGALIHNAYKPVAMRLHTMPVPTVAVVHGVAAGSGANLALGCDIVIAGQSGAFLQAFSKIGLIPDAGGTWLLPRLVGRPQALALALLADKLSAKEAERIGLIWRCVEDADLQGEASKLAQRLRGMPSAALVAVRHSIDRALLMTFEEAFDAEVTTQTRLGQAHDYTEGVRAFLAKRTPTFKDR